MTRTALGDPRFAQDHSMRLTSGDSDSLHILAVQIQGVVYTSRAVKTPPDGAPEEEGSLDSSNAAV
ncbi:MAG: hypothetical protein ACRD51_08070 [Candidatus Acidiferrum sp.]